MDAELTVALVGVVGGAVSALAGGIVNRTGRTRLERDADLYGKLAGMDGGPFEGAVLAKLKGSIEDRVLGVRFRRSLAALAIEAVVYLAAIAGSFVVLLATDSIDEEQVPAFASLMLILLLAFAVTLLAFQASFMYRDILGFLERRSAKKRDREGGPSAPEGREPGGAAEGEWRPLPGRDARGALMAMPLRSGGSERIMEDGETTAAAPPAAAPPPFPAAPPAPPAGSGKATAALVLGISAIVLSAAPLLGGKATTALALGIAAIVLCAAPLLGIGLGVAAVLVAGSYRKLLVGDGGGDPRAGRAKAGRVCGFVGIGLGALWTVVWAAAIALGVWAVSVAGVHEGPDPLTDPPAATQGPSSGGGSAADPDDVIIAGGADVSSKYAFEAGTAVVGLDEYSEAPVVVLVGDFTNESDETVSFSDALDAVATQDGRELGSAYLQGADAFSYESIAPGETVPVFVGWELRDAESDVEIVVRDRYHYAEQAVFEGAFTVDELLANTEALAGELEGIIDEGQELAA